MKLSIKALSIVVLVVAGKPAFAGTPTLHTKGAVTAVICVNGLDDRGDGLYADARVNKILKQSQTGTNYPGMVLSVSSLATGEQSCINALKALSKPYADWANVNRMDIYAIINNKNAEYVESIERHNGVLRRIKMNGAKIGQILGDV